jgi:Glutamate decarboxylase and related PLP-dependent proteins
MENPYVDCIGHLTGRKLNKRPPVEIDMERVIEKALETKTFLEMNSQPDRLDLRDVHARAAREAGLKLVVNSDGHEIGAQNYVEFGIGQARRAWLTKVGRREHADVEADRADQEAPPVDLRRDGAATLEWVASYLERVGELPVLAQVEPGWLLERLPEAPPETGEPFSALLDDLDRLILPAVTHWQHPRFLAYFPNTASDPAILAELLTIALNQVGILWRTGPALAELEERTTAWLGQLLGLPSEWHGHIEDTASTSTLAALIAARHTTKRSVVVSTEHPHSAADKAARMLGMELRKIPADDAFRLRADQLELEDVAAVVATVGTTSTTSVDPVAAIADRCEAAGTWLHVDAAYAGSAMVCPELRWAFEGVDRARLAGRQRPQMDVHAHGLLAALDQPTGRVPRRVLARPRVPAHDRRRRAQPERVRAVARPPFPLPEALGRPALLRRRRASPPHPGGDPSR